MKKSILLLLASVLLLPSCKKGDDDPLISLQTRKMRITGEWNMVEMDERMKNDDFGYTLKVEDGEYTYTDTDGDLVFGNHEEKLIINKDGTFKQDILITRSNNSKYYETTEGYWYFLYNNKEAETKNKEVILFREMDYSENETGGVQYTEEYGGITGGYFYIISLDKLKSNELEISTNIEETDPNSSRLLKANYTYEKHN